MIVQPGTAPDSPTPRAVPGSPPRAEPPRLRAGRASLHSRVRASGSWTTRKGLCEQQELLAAPRAVAATSPTAPRRCGTAPAPRRLSPSQRAGLGPGERPRIPAGPTPLACQERTPPAAEAPQPLLRPRARGLQPLLGGGAEGCREGCAPTPGGTNGNPSAVRACPTVAVHGDTWRDRRAQVVPRLYWGVRRGRGVALVRATFVSTFCA